MKGGTAASCGLAGGSCRRAPTPGLAAGPAEAAVEGRREGKGGGKKKKKSPTLRAPALAARACVLHPPGRGNRPGGLDAPADHFLGEGPGGGSSNGSKVSPVTQPLAGVTEPTPAKGGPWDPRGSGHRGGGFFWVPQTRVVCAAWRSTPSVGAAQTGFPATAESF